MSDNKRKVLILKTLKSFLISLKKQNETLTTPKRQNQFLTIEEKRELIAQGKKVPLCVGNSSESKRGIVKFYSIYDIKNLKLK